jgi:phosphate starvation-inducible PhoH-like protein
MFMFLTRLGTESKAVITGDPTQIDLPSNKRSGMIEALAALRDVEGIAFTRFGDRDVIRHELVQRIVSAYREHRGISEKK